MAIIQTHTTPLPPPLPLMKALSFKPRLLFFPLTSIRTFAASPPLRLKAGASGSPATLLRAPVSDLKVNWLDSLSCPFHDSGRREIEEREGFGTQSGSGWVIGIDPDASGALALLKDGDTGGGCSAQVFDTPHLQVMVGKRARKRLDARSIVQLLHSFGAPHGTTAYIEQSNPFPKDGKQMLLLRRKSVETDNINGRNKRNIGWWSGGFTYGLWLGVLVSSGFSVIPLSSQIWKDHFQLFRNSSTKDDSRKAASDLFPSLSSSLKRKKDHGRAEALLIAAYGKSLRVHSQTSLTSSKVFSPEINLEVSQA
ncbi:uncharacterized protein M6B38_285710 [Iris pallida]|uniref:Holliday junction resolvase MOC1, chloroplastic n=1 Tax=Iris pallida TaxID=29817 RepID=A0AAX6HZ36_IRIPA|nr:uncharacterized protein M6B38_285710 [Iris pallida]